MITLNVHIETLNGGFYYNLSYFLSALIIIVYTMYWGISKKFSLVLWTLSVVSILIFFIAGTRLFSMNKEDWQFFFDSGIIHLSNGRTVLGGIILAIPAALFCKYYFKLNFDFSKPFAFVIPIVVVVMRIGCLLVGCCYGTQCNLPWAISYGKNSPAFINQVNKGLISINDSHSLPIHPSQVYDIIFYLIIFFIVIKLRNKFKANHSLFYLIIVSRFFERFFLEFVREGESNNVFGIEFGGLKIVQWTLLFLISTFIFIIYYREKNFTYSENSFQIKFLQSNKIIFFTVMISVLLILVKPWMMRLEMMVIDLLVLMAIVSVFIYEIKQIRFMQFRFAPISLILICFVLMSQTVDIRPIDDFQFKGRKFHNDSVSHKLDDFIEFGFGYSQGNNSYQVDQNAGGCGSSDIHKHNQDFNMYKMNAAYRHYVDNNYSIIVGVNIANGRITDTDTTQFKIRSTNFTDVNPYFAFDSRRFGFGVGFHTMSQDTGKLFSDLGMPSMFIRYGNPSVFCVSGFFNNKFEDGLPIFVDKQNSIPLKVEFGSQFNTDFLLFRMGFTPYGYYFAPSIYILKKQFVLSPYLYVFNTNQIITSGQQFGVNLSYRIPVKTRGY